MKDRYTTAADLAGELRTHLDADKSSLPRNKTPWLIAFAAIFAALVAPFVWEKFQEPEQKKEIPEKKTLVKIIPPKKTPENSVEKDWLSRLGQLPKEIIWPGYRGTSTQGFEKDRNAFAVTSSKIRLYELGKLTKAGGTISVEISQPIPIGGFGIYLGYHVGQLKRDQMARFQLIWISIIQTKSGQTNFQIHRWKSVIHPGTATLIAEKELGTHRIPSLSSGTSLRLEIKVGRNGVESVKWGSTKLTNVASPGVEKSFGPEYYTNWGLFQSSGTTWFRNPSFRPHRK